VLVMTTSVSGRICAKRPCRWDRRLGKAYFHATGQGPPWLRWGVAHMMKVESDSRTRSFAVLTKLPGGRAALPRLMLAGQVLCNGSFRRG